MSTNKKMSIALVDDDRDESDFFQIALDFLGIDYQFRFFGNAKDFVSHVNNAETVLPDIVFVDMSMPEISGKDLIRQLRENSRFDSMQAVIYTAHISEKDKQAMMSLGTFEFFIKPTEFSELTEMLKEMIDRRAEKLNSNSLKQE
ncbi:response regulator [uncultured Flavobacterium sp.]|uniref:response regulator n=1 Tax=uncultured Flavobacterium sp. TaxID=165435 RepID=UPI0025F2F5A6|nr:response regulator [uncultured Flavobacterium sp.]